jgi:hypothetical protein
MQKRKWFWSSGFRCRVVLRTGAKVSKVYAAFTFRVAVCRLPKCLLHRQVQNIRMFCFWTLSIALLLFETRNVSETGFCLRLQVELTQLGLIDIASSYLRAPTTQSQSELLYDWRFTSNQFALAPIPLRLTTSDFFQVNSCGHSPYVISSLTIRWVCRLQLLLAIAGAHQHQT